MCDKERLVGYLYDELDDAERRVFEAHVEVCADCLAEVGSLRATRGVIAAWAPPERELELRVVRGAAPPPPRRASLPAWGLAAAATLVLATAAAIANIEVRSDASGLSVRTGWSRAAPAAAAVPPASDGAQAGADLVALGRRLSELEAALNRAPQAQPASAEARMSDAELLRRVRELIGDAETRQRSEVAQVLAQVVRDFERQRRTDIAMIEQGLGAYQGLTNAEIAQQRDMLNQLVRVATRQEK
jgi:hypothetical protein